MIISDEEVCFIRRFIQNLKHMLLPPIPCKFFILIKFLMLEHCFGLKRASIEKKKFLKRTKKGSNFFRAVQGTPPSYAIGSGKKF